MCFIVPRDEVDHGDIALLAVPVAAPDALFDPLRIPRKIVGDYGLAELEVQPFCAGLRANEDLRTCAKLGHEGEPHSNFASMPGSRRKAATCFFLPARLCSHPTTMVCHAT